jgi:thiamine-phosphate pyrophosphorylase
MRPRQTIPRQWLIIGGEAAQIEEARKLRRGSGILLLRDASRSELRALRQIARQRDLTVATEGPRSAARVHNVRELRRAMLRRTPIILLSPLFPTGSHPDWEPLRRMRAAALARLGRRNLFALGGMDARKFGRIERLGFRAWAGISAFRT